MQRFRLTAELGVALGVLGLALFFALGTFAITVTPTYSRVGPKVIPTIVAIALAAIGAALLFQAVSGRWQTPADAKPNNLRSFLWAAGGLIVNAALMTPAGFFIASTALFVCVARAFGSARWLRDGAIGAAVAAVAYFGFTHVLQLSLPAGSLWGIG
jgi:putative tricarboxylic transport membrane protein